MPEATPGRPAAAPLPRRFYREVTTSPADGGLVLTLDGRPARTPGRKPLAFPTGGLAAAIAAEWDAQVELIDPRTMPLTKLANSTIDGVVPRAGEVRDEILRYAGSDLVCYRAGDPDSLVATQSAAWDPVVAWTRIALGAPLVLAEGVMFVEQPRRSLERLRATLEAERSPFRLAALNVLTTMGGSALIALMHASDAMPLDDAWRAVHVDEFHQERLWGEDLEATRRRTLREAEFRAAARFLALSHEA